MGLRQDNKINGAATVRERSVPLKSPKYRSWHTLSPCRVRNLGGVITLQSGAPLTPMSGGPGGACFNDRGIRANVIGGNPEGAKSIDNWFNVGAFEAVPQFQFGDAGRDLFEGPGIATTKLSLTKDIHFTERVVLKLRSDFFNMFNRANFNNPNTSIPVRDAAGNLTGSTNFISGTRGENDGQPQIQLSVKVVF